MTRYWVIAPHSAELPDILEKVWQFDLDNGVISLGWNELGDISSYDEDDLRAAIERTYTTYTPASVTRSHNMLWWFYHKIQLGDIIIARRGRKRIAAIGTVTETAYYERAKNESAAGKDHFHSNYIGVRWHNSPRDKEFDRIVFGIQALYKVSEGQYEEWVGDSGIIAEMTEEGIENQTEFILEKYLEDFIVSNFAHIFGDGLVLYQDPDEKVAGKQYATDIGIIDILAQEPSTDAFVVIELKKGRESDRVVGQLLRYIGWVDENLCSQGQPVKGMIICRDADLKLSYALRPVSDIVTVKYYRVDFKLGDKPFKVV